MRYVVDIATIEGRFEYELSIIGRSLPGNSWTVGESSSTLFYLVSHGLTITLTIDLLL